MKLEVNVLVKLQVSEPLSGTQKASGTVTKAEVKTIKPNNGGDPFPILEFTLGDIQGPIRDIIGKGTLTVGLTSNRITSKSRIGKLATALFGWDGKEEVDTDDFLGTKMEFLVESQENASGEFWNIDRNSLGPVGHLP